MRRGGVILVLALLCAAGLGAQSVDVAVGAGSQVTGFTSGGYWPSFSATVMLNRWVGINGAFAFRTERKQSSSGLFRPWIAGANAVVRPLSGLWTPEIFAGFAELHSETETCQNCVPVVPPFPQGPFFSPAQNYPTFHLGFGLHAYIHGHTFLAIQYHIYFSEPLGNQQRVAFLLGYTFGGH